MEKNALLKANKKIEGVGLGLRFPHFNDILNKNTKAPWFEVITEDFLDEGPHHNKLLQLRVDSPIVLHSIGLNIGGTQKFDKNYLSSFKEIYNKFEPEYISDHLCWSAHNGIYHHDLLPIPYTKEGLENAISRIQYLQDYFARPLVLENITSYIDFKSSDYSEIEFVKELVRSTGCKLLLDITNVIINHKNRNIKEGQYFDNFPLESVVYCHISGAKINEGDDIIIDAHDSEVSFNEVEIIKNKLLDKPILLERDASLPSLEALEGERSSIEVSIYEL